MYNFNRCMSKKADDRWHSLVWRINAIVAPRVKVPMAYGLLDGLCCDEGEITTLKKIITPGRSESCLISERPRRASSLRHLS
jgi:hypothetical protein